MKNYNIEELLEWLNKSDSRMISIFLKELPMIGFRDPPLQLFVYSENIILVKSGPQQSLALEGLIHPDRFIGEPIPLWGNPRELMNAPIDTLFFHKYYYLKDRSYLSVLSGQLEQILGIIRLFGFK